MKKSIQKKVVGKIVFFSNERQQQKYRIYKDNLNVEQEKNPHDIQTNKQTKNSLASLEKRKTTTTTVIIMVGEMKINISK